MEQHLKKTIIHSISGILGVGGIGAMAWAFLIALTIPTVTEEFTNKLLFYALIMAELAMFGVYFFVSSTFRSIGKARLHWHLRRVSKDED